MTIGSLVGAVRRRWYVLVVGLLLTAGAIGYLWSAPACTGPVRVWSCWGRRLR